MSANPYERATAYLFGRIDYERAAAVTYGARQFKLARMHELLDAVGNPERKIPIVHVAGTKGKGSTSTMIAAVLSAAGYRTGLFTSPHLDRLEERMAMDGVNCSSEDFVALGRAACARWSIGWTSRRPASGRVWADRISS